MNEPLTGASGDQRTVAVAGLGYVGLPLALLFAGKGFRVLGIDLDPGKLEMLHKGKSYIRDISDEAVEAAMASGHLMPTSQYSSVQAAEAVIICVPTPLTEYGTPELSYLTEAAVRLSKELKKGQLIVLESSTYPGTTREVLLPILAKSGLALGTDYHVAYSPERVDPGNMDYPLERIPKIVSGATKGCLERICELYGEAFPRLHAVSSTNTAEMAKIVENTYRLINISFVNELAMHCDELGLDVWEVIDAAATKPFGYHAFYPGPGIGGHCIPVDPSYLSWKMKQHGLNAEFIGLSNAVNHRMPVYVVQRIKQALSPKSLAGSSILVYGAAYKPDIADSRESASVHLIELLRLEGANVYYHDPHIPVLTAGDASLKSSPMTPELLEQMDCVVIATHHSAMPLELMMEHASLIYDTRNATRAASGGRAKVIRLGAGSVRA